jgi:hypothetical protein
MKRAALLCALLLIGAGVVACRPAKGGAPRVYLFVLSDCPLANLAWPSVGALAREYPSVSFVAVYCDPSLSDEARAAHAKAYAIPFATTADRDGALTRQYGATHSPQAILVNAAGEMLYSGRIDDRAAAPGVKRREPTQRDLAEALKEFSEGRAVSLARTTPVGCPLP